MQKGDRLGDGTYGIVYEMKIGNESYALKRNLTEKESTFMGATREVNLLYLLQDHPYIVDLESVIFGSPFESNVASPLMGKDRKGQRDDSIHFLFEKSEKDLHSYLYDDGACDSGDKSDFGLSKMYMVHLLLGLEYMHEKKIIHRDLKPSNILIYGSGPTSQAKLCDFGLSKPYTYQDDQTPKIVTSAYRAPEILLGDPGYDYKIDVWSLGCIFFEMISKKLFIYDKSDRDEVILKRILKTLPVGLTPEEFKKWITLNPWKEMKIRNPKVAIRKSYFKQLGLSIEGIKEFKNQNGSVQKFSKLLHGMLEFDKTKRLSASEALLHDFFREYRDLIKETQESTKCPTENHRIEYPVCKERLWMSHIAIGIYNNRGNLEWYTHRILFQAIDLFHRYLNAMYSGLNDDSNLVESNSTGKIHDKFETELRFWACIYTSIKYFSSIHCPIPYSEVVPKEFTTQICMDIVEQFEGGLIKNCVQFDIYHPTVYEVADDFQEKLTEMDIRNLLLLFTVNIHLSGKIPGEVFEWYCHHLRDPEMNLERLTLPFI